MANTRLTLFGWLVLVLLTVADARAAEESKVGEGVPRLQHVFVIIEENMGFDEVTTTPIVPPAASRGRLPGRPHRLRADRARARA
ncbi:MAG TPA: hypothetical protein VLF14_12605, partial [Candidatus Binatia bacterium]|nr:hypothetical protein [Candidatus Binatia bacterium]